MRQRPAKIRRRAVNRLWRWRTTQQLSQREIARLLGIKNSAQVSRWENGAKIPTLDSALMLACILKVPVEALFADRAAELRALIDQRVSQRTPHSRPPHEAA